MEHAANFARSWEPPANQNNLDKETSSPVESIDDILIWHQTSRHRQLFNTEPNQVLDRASSPQQPLSDRITEKDKEEGDDEDNTLPGGPPDLRQPSRGYFQTYQANRPLNLLYIDGEGAAKSPLGSMDSQDLILMSWNHTDDLQLQMKREFYRATAFCALAEEWSFAAGGKIDGFVRMEAGFEIIYCDFTPAGGLDLLSVQASPFKNESGIDEGKSSRHFVHVRIFEWLRASATRFYGQPAGRLNVDWSSMVSAFSYPVNLSNPNPGRQDLPRLVNATTEGLQTIRSRLRDVIFERGGKDTATKGAVNWQGLVDKIVTRYSQRLLHIANPHMGPSEIISHMTTLIGPFMDYLDHSPMANQLAINRCAQQYFGSLSLHPDTWTPEDYAISAAIETVSSNICISLFMAWQVLLPNSTTTSDTESSVVQAQNIIRNLNRRLKWSTWKECGTCAADESCSIPMFPFGSVEDYFNPRCKNITDVMTLGYFYPKNTTWDFQFG